MRECTDRVLLRISVGVSGAGLLIQGGSGGDEVFVEVGSSTSEHM